jgi:type III restriction enzyme
MEEVKLFLKLPGWFTVPTPIGEYNPDWAIVWQGQDAFGEPRERLYLVRETKGSLDEAARRGSENMKIACARRHFGAIQVDYGDVTSAEELREEVLKLQEKS